MKSNLVTAGQTGYTGQYDALRDDARAASWLLVHQQLGALALPTNPSNGQTITFTYNGTAVTLTGKTGTIANPGEFKIQGTPAATGAVILAGLQNPQTTTATFIALSPTNQAFAVFAGYALNGTTITIFALNNSIYAPLTSFTASTTVTSGTWTAQTMQLYVEPGTYYVGTTRILYLGGSTPTFTAPSTHPRIDLVTADSSGTIALVTGTEASSPVAPSYPTNKIVLAEVTHVVGETALYDNDNQQTGQGFISNDVRPIAVAIYISNSTQIAAQALDGSLMWNLNNIPSGAGVIPTVNLPANSFNAQTFTAAAATTTGQALILGSGKSGYLTFSQTSHPNGIALSSSSILVAQTFTTSSLTTAIRAVTFWDSTSGSATGTVALYATSGGVPTGSALGTTTIPFGGSQAANTATFSSPVSVSPNTVYALAISVSSSLAQVYYNPSGFGGGVGVVQSTNGGSTWGSVNTSECLHMQLYEVLTMAGQVQPSDTTKTIFSTDVYDLAMNFCGFALASVSGGATVNVNLGPIDADQSGLTPGIEYFLNGAAGAIATTAGAVSVKIGLAMSATQLLIKFDNF
jgi:hypothetical protein